MSVVKEEKNYARLRGQNTHRAGKKANTNAVIVLLKVFGDHRLVLRECLLQVRIRVARDAKCRRLDVMREHVEAAPHQRKSADATIANDGARTCQNKGVSSRAAHA